MLALAGLGWYFPSCSHCIAQGGTEEHDSLKAVTVLEDGSILLAGYTAGEWTKPNLGGLDFAVVKVSTE